MRRHLQQMSQDEKAFVHGFLRANAAKINGASGHFYDRATERHFTLAEAVEAVKSGLVIEVHNDVKYEIRALVRDRKGTCVVVSLTDFRVVTVYYNDPEDNHHSLNWNLYRWPVNLVNVVKELRKAA